MARGQDPSAGKEPASARGGDAHGYAYVAERLRQAGQLTDAQHALVLETLEKGPARGRERPLSVLHVMEELRVGNTTASALYLARDSSLPLIPLRQFTPQKEAYSLLPMDIMKKRGALAFDTLAESVLVAVLNPYDTELQTEVERETGHICNFYLALPSDYDETLNRILNA
ncbi:MAG: hypothetical protein JXR37_11660 [Kiritimatiellae bacterium]|nr:hypothetical protein [Kiritimatiellia bacterium]